MMRSIVLVLLLAALTTSSSANEKVRVTVFYESLCGDSMRFFEGQVKPTQDVLGPHIDFDFVPYGKAKHESLNNSYSFTCHHGRNECEYNKLHSCAIKYIPDQNKTVSFLSCLMGSYRQSSVRDSCAETYSVSMNKINDCSASKEGDELHADYGKRTMKFEPSISYVPTIVLNGVYDTSVQNEAEYNLLEAVCKKLESKPEGCPKS